MIVWGYIFLKRQKKKTASIIAWKQFCWTKIGQSFPTRCRYLRHVLVVAMLSCECTCSGASYCINQCFQCKWCLRLTCRVFFILIGVIAAVPLWLWSQSFEPVCLCVHLSSQTYLYYSESDCPEACTVFIFPTELLLMIFVTLWHGICHNQ